MTVYLVGAGPGDPGLITVRGAELLRRADVVVHDRLSEVSLLDLAPSSAERIDVGKTPGGPVRQDEINEILVAHGRAGREVVRLKGGDPFVFGRGGEEAAALAEAGVPFEVVPGITSAVAVPAYAGIPVTHRGLSTSFTVVTGHSRHQPERDTDWAALARAGDTIVVLMGVAHRASIADALIAGGLAAATPVAAVTWGTRPEQRTVRTTLGALADTVVEPPATIVIGQVAALDLAWFERRPLFGKRVVVTRAASQARGLSSRLRDLGAEVLEVPTIRIADPADAGVALTAVARTLPTYEWVVFTSANAVERLLALVHDARAFGGAQVAAIGPGTADALRSCGIVADLVPARSVAESLVEDFPVGDGRVLLPQAADARPAAADGLRGKGWHVDVVEAYRTEPVPITADRMHAVKSADAIAFTAASTAKHFVTSAGADSAPPVVVCIGPVTAEAATALGLSVSAVAAAHNLDGLVAAVCEALGPA